MEKYLKNNNGFTVKELIFTIVAIIIAFVIGFVLSNIFTNKKQQQYIDQISDLEDQIQELEEGLEDTDSEEENNEEIEEYKPTTTEDILMEAYYNAIEATYSLEYKEIENDDSKLEITNYDETMKDIFTENGQKIYEEENKNMIEKKDGKAYMLITDSKNLNDYLYDFDFENINEENNTITATVVRTMTRESLVLMNDDDVEKAEKYTLKDEIILKKVNDNWLVDKYSLET